MPQANLGRSGIVKWELLFLRNLNLTSFGQVGRLGFSTIQTDLPLNIRKTFGLEARGTGQQERKMHEMSCTFWGQSSSLTTLQWLNMAGNHNSLRNKMGRALTKTGELSSQPCWIAILLSSCRETRDPRWTTYHRSSPEGMALPRLWDFFGMWSGGTTVLQYWFITLGEQNPRIQSSWKSGDHNLLHESIDCLHVHRCIHWSGKAAAFIQKWTWLAMHSALKLRFQWWI